LQSGSLGSNPVISQKYKMAEVSKKVANTLQPAKKYGIFWRSQRLDKMFCNNLLLWIWAASMKLPFNFENLYWNTFLVTFCVIGGSSPVANRHGMQENLLVSQAFFLCFSTYKNKNC
jgi:hypothetical protein